MTNETLRVGNWITGPGGPVQYTTNLKLIVYDPIALDDTWLTNYGFETYLPHEEAAPSWRMQVGPFAILRIDVVDGKYFLNMGDRSAVIPYVHTLQNLAQAVCGEELVLVN